MAGNPRWWHPLGSVRVRTTAAATVVVAVALIIGAFALVEVQRSILTENIDDALLIRADDLQLLLEGPEPPPSLVVREQEEALVQIVDDTGEVVAASQNVVGLEPVVDPGDEALQNVSHLPIDDEEFRVLSRTVEASSGSYTIIVAESLEPIGESLEALQGILVVGLPILLAVMALLTWLVVGRALRPVDSIRAEVAGITGRRLDRRVPEPATHDEIGRLARTMNDMLDRLQSAHDRQDRFVADASHELRSPLTSMRSELEVDLAHTAEADWLATHRRVLDDVEELQTLVDDLLFLARSEAAGPVTHERVDLDDLVLAEVNRMRQRGRVAVDQSGVSAGQVTGDQRQLARLVRNLLDNAEQHAAGGVTVGLTENGNEVHLTVVDDGPGIPADARALIFERFTQLDDSRTRERTGTGLGLAIAQDIVSRHRGSIAVESPDGEGATFVVRLPRAGA